MPAALLHSFPRVARRCVRVAAVVLATPLSADSGAVEGAGPAPPSASSLRAWHDLLGSEPHVAGTPGDARQIERLRRAFDAMGLAVEVQEIYPLLARPIAASLEIVQQERDAAGAAAREAPDSPPAKAPQPKPGRRGVMGLDLRERNLVEDPSTAHADLSWGWNAYSASGDITAPVVYANHGTREDFAALRSMGIECDGAIVLARYGRNFRGDKVRFAEEAGAAGLVIFSDPADVARGPSWPEGGWANDTCIQRGSILKKARPGDPLTPDGPATRDAPRIAVDDADLPRIPVQPIGFGAAARIFAAMGGVAAPQSWQGGLPMTYRLAGGEGVSLRLRVEQERATMATANVVATLPGASDEFVVIGCHHDAWGFGAADPLAGTIVLLETAQAFADAAQRGWTPRRTLVFAAWGAEEFGIIGSTEWCEAHAEAISARCVAYLNLDMASMGEQLGAKASPLLFSAIRAAADAVPQARDASRSALAAWAERSAAAQPASTPPVAAIGLIDGGSDHEAFQYLLGVPSATLFASGGQGTSYHSNYDTLGWYRSVVGEDYEPALMVSRFCLELARLLADSEVPPLDPRSMAEFLRTALDDVERFAGSLCTSLPRGALDAAIARYAEAAAATATDPANMTDAAAFGPAAERPWLRQQPGRWHRHALYGPNPDSGYSAETLPALRAAVRSGDPAAIEVAALRLLEQIEAATAALPSTPPGVRPR